MIKQTEIKNGFGESLIIKLGEPIIRTDGTYASKEEGIFITEIEGLGPVKADIKMGESATRHGGRFNSARANCRDISFHFLFLDINGLTVEDGRLTIYKFFPLTEEVTVYFNTENRNVRVKGYVESIEPDIFTDQAGATVTIKCPSAWFILSGVRNEDVNEFSNLEKMFEFEFADEPSPSLIFNSLEPGKSHEIDYPGEIVTGMTISIKGKPAENVNATKFRLPTIYNNETREKMAINTNMIEKILNPNWTGRSTDPSYLPDTDICTIGADDEILISTVTGNKYVRFIRENKTYNILRALPLNTDWLTLHPGKNVFSYKCATDTESYAVDITMTAFIYVAGV